MGSAEPELRRAEPELQAYWDVRAAGNFIFGGAGAGLLFLTVLAAQQDASWLLRTGPVALALVGAGLGCVFLELGRPLRAINVFFRPRTSWMSREAIAASALFPVAFAAVVLRIPTLSWVAGALALVFLYCQGRLLKAAKGIPALREPAIVGLVFATGLAEGAALLVIVAVAFVPPPAWGLAALALVVAVRLATWLVYRSRLTASGAAPKGTAEVLSALHRPIALAGHALPLGLFAIALGDPASASSGALALTGAVLALAAGWYLKFALITRAAYNQGFAIARAPARTPGYSRPGAKPGWT